MLTRLLGAAAAASLATGVPGSFLQLAGCSDRTKAALAYDPRRSGRARFLVMALSRHGHPINANAPGSYEHDGITHPSAPEAQRTTFRLGEETVRGAQAWSTLPQPILDRTCFFHGATGTTIHADLPRVLALMGASAHNEMLPSLFSAALAPELETVLRSPVSLLGEAAWVEEYLEFEGRRLPNHPALSIRDALTDEAGPLARLGRLRDRAMDDLHARLKRSGTSEEKAFVDGVAQSQVEARDLGEKLLAGLGQVTSNDAGGQIAVAAALIRMRITPVVVLGIPLGGDNHKDPSLKTEESELVTGVAQIGMLMARLQDLGIAEQTSFMTFNPFGRTLRELGDQGRNHLDHHVAVVIGKGIRAGVIGGVTPVPLSEYVVQNIDSTSGRGVPEGGDVAAVDTLASLAKTVGSHLGLSEATLAQSITKGKVVPAALVA